MNYTLESFEAEFKALLRKAEDAGLDVDQFCEVAEFILSDGWSSDEPTATQP